MEETGFHLFPCGFLGSSPDGVIFPKDFPGINGALEIKCPCIKVLPSKKCLQKNVPLTPKRKFFFLQKICN